MIFFYHKCCTHLKATLLPNLSQVHCRGTGWGQGWFLEGTPLHHPGGSQNLECREILGMFCPQLWASPTILGKLKKFYSISFQTHQRYTDDFREPGPQHTWWVTTTSLG